MTGWHNLSISLGNLGKHGLKPYRVLYFRLDNGSKFSPKHIVRHRWFTFSCFIQKKSFRSSDQLCGHVDDREPSSFPTSSSNKMYICLWRSLCFPLLLLSFLALFTLSIYCLLVFTKQQRVYHLLLGPLSAYPEYRLVIY